MKWNSKNTTYYGKGKKAYKKGDTLPAAVVSDMGEETVTEYLEKGIIVTEGDSKKSERLALLKEAEALGLSPHPKTGIEKLKSKIEDFNALAELKKEALTLGIDPSDDVEYPELKTLVDEKKNESDS